MQVTTLLFTFTVQKYIKFYPPAVKCINENFETLKVQVKGTLVVVVSRYCLVTLPPPPPIKETFK